MRTSKSRGTNAHIFLHSPNRVRGQMPLFLAFRGAVPLFGKGAPIPPSRPTSGIAVARATCQRRQRHRSHAQTIRAVARIVEHGEEPPFDRRAREGMLCCRRGASPLKFASAHHAAVLGSYASERSEGSSLRGADHRATTFHGDFDVKHEICDKHLFLSAFGRSVV